MLIPFKSVLDKLPGPLLATALLLFCVYPGEAGFSQAADRPAPVKSTEADVKLTFTRDIAPIIYQDCSGCHHPISGPAMAGEAPFPLITYEDAKTNAAAIAGAVRSRAMPPWLPEPGYGDFADDPRLTGAQIRLIAEWVRDGAPEGSLSAAPVTPHFDGGWALGKPDLVITAPRPITVPASGPDVFWNFIFSPNIKTKRYVRAIEVRPGGDLSAIHHANVILDPSESARTLEKEPGAGFPGMDLPLRQDPSYVPSHFLFWKPGNTTWIEPAGLSWELDPGTDLVLNAHFMAMEMQQVAQPSIGLYFTDEPPKLFPMVIELENDDALDIPANDKDFVVTDDFRLPRDVDVLAIYPHAHYLGHLLEAYATLPDGQRKWLIRIPNWDFQWQAIYHYREPVSLPKGTVVSMRYHYDNSASNPHNPHNPPQRVLGGNQSTDEMAHLWLQVLPRGERPADGRIQIEQALLEHRVEKFSDDFGARLNLGALLLAQSNAPAAVNMLEQAIRLDAKQEDAHRILGMALERVGRLQEAISQFRAAVTLKPDDNEARYGLARGLVRASDLQGAIAEFQKAADAEPHNSAIRDDFGVILMRQGHPAEALEQFDAALKIDPSQKQIQQDRDKAQRRLQTQ